MFTVYVDNKALCQLLLCALVVFYASCGIFHPRAAQTRNVHLSTEGLIVSQTPECDWPLKNVFETSTGLGALCPFEPG